MPSGDSQPCLNTEFTSPPSMRSAEIHDFQVERILIATIAGWAKRLAEVGGKFLFGSGIMAEITGSVEVIDGVRDAVRTENRRALHQMKMQMRSRAIAGVPQFRENLRALDAVAEPDGERIPLQMRVERVHAA